MTTQLQLINIIIIIIIINSNINIGILYVKTPLPPGDKPIADNNNNTNSVALVRERTIPTERPPPVGEVSANFCG